MKSRSYPPVKDPTPAQLAMRQALALLPPERRTATSLNASSAGVGSFLKDMGFAVSMIHAQVSHRTGSCGGVYLCVDGLRMDIHGHEGDAGVAYGVLASWDRSPARKTEFREEVVPLDVLPWLAPADYKQASEVRALLHHGWLDLHTAPVSPTTHRALRF